MLQKQNYLPALLTLFILYAFGLLQHALNLSFFVLLIIAVMTLLHHRLAFKNTLKQYWPLHIAMCAMVLAVGFTQLFEGYFNSSPYNPASRLAVFAPIFALLLLIPIEKLRLMPWAWIIGIILCTLYIYFLPKDVINRPITENWRIALASLLGVFSLISWAWNERTDKFSIALHLIGGGCGLATVYLSGTRGVWLAIPVFCLLIFLTYYQRRVNAKSLLVLGLGVILAIVIVSFTDMGSKRIQQVQQDLDTYSSNKNAYSSIGIRLQLWEASWILFKEHPLLGTGTGERYHIAMQDLVERKILPSTYNDAHSHNEILYSMVTMGIGGLLAMMLVYLVPSYYFIKDIRHSDRQIRAASAMGLAVCFGFMIFGTVDVLFKYKETDVFYCVSCALFLAYIIGRKKELCLFN